MDLNKEQLEKKFIERFPMYINRLNFVLLNIGPYLTPDIEYKLISLYNDIFNDCYLNIVKYG